MKTWLLKFLMACGLMLVLSFALSAQVPNLVPHQGRVAVNGVNFDGNGQFKFALVNANGSTTYWSNDGTSTAGSQPTAGVSLPVSKGLYSVMLGDTALTNMTAVPASVFANSDVRLRVWFNNGTLGFQQLSPDQRLAPNGYLPAGAVSAANLTPGTLIPTRIVAGTTQAMIANTSYTATSSSPASFTLPSSANIGDIVEINGTGTGAWSVIPQSGQTIASPWIAREKNRYWRSVASSADGSKLVAVVASGQIYISADSGVTWTPRGINRFWYSVASSADGSKLVAVALGDQIYTSTDFGVTWTPRESERQWVSVTSSADGSKLVAAVYLGQIYTSIDSGVTWVPRESNRNWQSVASSADGSKLVALVNGGQIYTSSDFGVTWTPRESNRTWISVASSADGSKLVAVADGIPIYTSTDSGVTWSPRESNRLWQSVASSADGSKLVAGVFQGQIYISIDSGVTWTPRESNGNWQSMASSADGNKLVAGDTGGQIHTADATAMGGQGLSASLQYLGGGRWASLGPNKLEAGKLIGAVPSASLTSVPADNLTGSVPPASLTSVPAASLTGIVDVAQLPAGAALRSGGNAFTDNQSIIGNLTVTGSVAMGSSNSATGFAAVALGGNSQASGNYSMAIGNGTAATAGNSIALGSSTTASHAGTFVWADALGTPFGTTQQNQFIIRATGGVGIGTASPGMPLQVGDVSTPNSQGMMRFASRSGTGPSSRYWDIGVPEGDQNVGGKNYSFVIDDPTSGGDPELTIRWDSGNVGLGTANPQGRLHLYSSSNPTAMRIQSSGTPGFGRLEFVSNPQGDTNEWRPAYIQSTDNGGFTGGMSFVVNGTGSGSKFGELETMRIENGRVGIGTTAPVSALQVIGTVTATAFNPSSDRNLKENFEPVDTSEVLEKVLSLPLSRWNFKGDGDTPHIGAMAQDFHAAFGTGTDDKHIATVDADGVALAAIQGLHAELAKRDDEIRSLQESKAELERRLAAVEQFLRDMPSVERAAQPHADTP